MKRRPPIVALVVPCYNESEVLAETIEILNAVVDEQIEAGSISPDSFLYLVDDGSGDTTWSIIEDAHKRNARVKGLKLADVRADGPADKAGLKGGDIIVEFAGQKIAGLQDYADALTGAKIGEPVPVIILRNGERITLTLVPATRPE